MFKGELDQTEIKGIDLNDLYILEQGTRHAGAKKFLNQALRSTKQTPNEAKLKELDNKLEADSIYSLKKISLLKTLILIKRLILS